MPRDHILAVIQAGGTGGRMDVLTRERAKPALPFAGVFQLVDFPLSNLAHSGITDVWLSVQFLGASLGEQVRNGRPWDLDRNRGGLRLLMPEEGNGSADEDGFAHGNADELYRIRDQVTEEDPDLLVVLSADHVYRFDLMDAVRTHRRTGAECTVVTTTVPVEEAGDHATVETDADGRVTGFAYKPDRPRTGTIAAEIFVYDPAVLVPVLEQLHRELGMDADEGDSGLGDFGDHLLPRLVDRGRVFAHAMPGYWRDLGQPHKYLAAHRDVLVDDRGVLGEPGWPIIGHQLQRPPARVLDGGRVADSLLSPGSVVRGTVLRSVLGPGVVVEEGALVRDSVVFQDTVVAEGARLDWSIIDRDCVVGHAAEVGEPDTDPDDPDAIVLVGRGSTIGPGVALGAGSRLEPGTTA
ncbi:glucose-1-phosphate adenylyltransferase family protein [Nocardioides sp. T2.26MG-1]|uniref:glucose-1-phosphate adenylyltransferase family protein n=1 Tax=Nocardioides sp. T2.26MG-1 TaxID=3041166 RepID=UPI00247786F3|nr:sugar phosphate nucleotidyltransferase [Nocardioides sp. T2.26MG-1]CAI9407186.1 Glucose-1-phosphate adenylyltransferase [Nocardioides sp. T2.26MG-1]